MSCSEEPGGNVQTPGDISGGVEEASIGDDGVRCVPGSLVSTLKWVGIVSHLSQGSRQSYLFDSWIRNLFGGGQVATDNGVIIMKIMSIFSTI